MLTLLFEYAILKMCEKKIVWTLGFSVIIYGRRAMKKLYHLSVWAVLAALFSVNSAQADITLDYSPSLGFNRHTHNTPPSLKSASEIKIAGVYWLPDYLEKNLDFNDRSQPGGGDDDKTKVDCASLGYSYPDFVDDISKFSYTEFLAANKLYCKKNFSCKNSYKYTEENCSDDHILAGEICTDKDGKKYERCDEIKCADGFTAGLTSCSPEAGYTYTTKGTAGSKICGKCTPKACAEGDVTPKCDGINYKETNTAYYSGSSVCKKCEAIPCPAAKKCDYGCKTLDTLRKEMCGSVCTECTLCVAGGSSSCSGQTQKCAANEVQTSSCKDCSGTEFYSCRAKTCADEGLLDSYPKECGKQSCAVKTVNGKTCYSCRNVQTGDTLFADFTLGYSEITNGLQMPDKKIIGMAIRELVPKGTPIQRAWGAALQPSNEMAFAAEYEVFNQVEASEDINNWGDYDAMQTTLGLFEKKDAYPAAQYVYDYNTEATHKGEWSIPATKMNKAIDYFTFSSCKYPALTDAEIQYNYEKNYRSAYSYLAEVCKIENGEKKRYWSFEQGSALNGGVSYDKDPSSKTAIQTDSNNSVGAKSDKIAGRHKVWPVIDFCRVKTCNDAGLTFSIPEAKCGKQSCAKKIIDGVTCYSCREPFPGDALYEDFTIGYQYASKGLQLPYEDKEIIGYIILDTPILGVALQPSLEPLQFSTSTDLIDFVETTEEKYEYSKGVDPYLTASHLMQTPDKYPAVSYAYNYSTKGTKKGDWALMRPTFTALHLKEPYKDLASEYSVHMQTDLPYVMSDCGSGNPYWVLDKRRSEWAPGYYSDYIKSVTCEIVSSSALDKPTEARYVLPMIDFCRIQEERGQRCTAIQAAEEYAALPEKYKQNEAVTECPQNGDCKTLCNGDVYVGGCLDDNGTVSAGTNNGDYAYCAVTNSCNLIDRRSDAESTTTDACDVCSLAGYSSSKKAADTCVEETIQGKTCYKQCCDKGYVYDVAGASGAGCYKCQVNAQYSMSEHNCICNAGYTDIDGVCYLCESGTTACKNPNNNGVYCIPNDINNNPCSACTFKQACDHQPGKWQCDRTAIVNGETCYFGCDTWSGDVTVVLPDGSTSVTPDLNLTDDSCRHIGSFD